MSTSPGGFLPGLEPQGLDSRRMMIIAVAMTAIAFVMPLLMPKPTPTEPKPSPTTTAATTPATTDAAAAAIAAPTAAQATPDDAPEQTVVVKADVAAHTPTPDPAVRGGYVATLSNKGAQLRSFALTGYDDHTATDPTTGKALPIDLAFAQHDNTRSMALVSRGGDVALAADATYDVVSSDAKTATFERKTAAGVRITRAYVFDERTFTFRQTITLKNEGDAPKTAAFDVVLTGDEGAADPKKASTLFTPAKSYFGGACRKVDSSPDTFDFDKAKKETRRVEGNLTFAALDKHYFLAALVPERVDTVGCSVAAFTTGAAGVEEKDQMRGVRVTIEQQPITLAPGEVRSFSYNAYFGPKQVGLLKAFGFGLDANIDFGWFGALSRPILWLLVQINKGVGNFGIAIILLTLFMKLITFPLTQSSYASMQKMRNLKPELDELNKKYAGDRTTLGQKQMELYQKRGINPLAGCLPVAVQMPIWFALYRTLSSAVELYQQPFAFGIHDLTQADHLLPFGLSLLPLLVGALWLGQTAMQPPPDDQPQMKYMMWLMPVVFTFLMLSMASGLSIYMITNSVLTMAQQAFVKYRYNRTAPAAPTS